MAEIVAVDGEWFVLLDDGRILSATSEEHAKVLLVIELEGKAATDAIR